jgi:hypothetical protein
MGFDLCVKKVSRALAGMMVAAACVLLIGGVASAAGSPAIAVTPTSGLSDGQQVTVNGSGWVPGHSIALFECHSSQLPGNGPPCGNFAPSATADVNGAFQVLFTVQQSLVATNNGNAVYDCAVAPGCNIVVGDFTTSTFRTAHLSFGPSSSPVVTVTPSTGLNNLQTVNVSGTGYDLVLNGGNTAIIECATQQAQLCDRVPGHFGAAPIQPDHSFSVPFVVRRTFQGSLNQGGPTTLVDCTIAPGCSIAAYQSAGFGSAQRVSFLTPDATAPTVTLTTPPDGAVYAQGSVVAADFACADEAGGSGLASCVGTVANGAAIDTSTVGDHSFQVTGTDNEANSASVTNHYTVLRIAATTDECKNDGWKVVVDSNLRAFKNQGDCVSFVATGGRNFASG